MNRLAIARPQTVDQATELARDRSFALPMYKAGGMDVVDHLKEGLIEPDLLIDVRQLRSADDIDETIRLVGRDTDDAVIEFDAGVTLAELAASDVIKRRVPVVAQACGSAATPQVRNVASAAGNLLQRPRCWYYRNKQFDCLKKGGERCFAIDGENAYHAVFGDGPCYIVHPSNLAFSMYVTDGVVRVSGGDRDQIPITDLFHLPHRGVRSEHNLEPGELVTSLAVKPQPTSAHYAIKHKQSFDWPLAAAAVALQMNGSTIEEARICAGAVAPVPWPLPQVEQALQGVNIEDSDAVRRACERSMQGARPLSGNAYKLRLLPVAIHRAILKATGRPIPGLAETEDA